MTGYDPYEHADELGIRVIHRPIRTANGIWLPEHQLIVVKSGLRAVHDRTTLAHEIGHAIHGHRDDRPKHENQADMFAAHKLINPQKLERAGRWIPDLPSLAAELGVTTRLLAAYLAQSRQAA